MVATKAFLVTLVMMPVMMLGGLVVMPLLGKIGGPKDRQIVVADGTEKLLELISTASEERNASIQAMIETQLGEDVDGDPISGTEYFHFQAAPQSTLTDDDRLALSERIRQGDLYAFVELPAGMIESDQSGDAKFVSQDAAQFGTPLVGGFAAKSAPQCSPARTWPGSASSRLGQRLG